MIFIANFGSNLTANGTQTPWRIKFLLEQMKLQLGMVCQSYTQKRIRFISHDFRLSSFLS